MDFKLPESDRKVLEQLWEMDGLPASELADRLRKQVGWSTTTTYTIVKRCIGKKLVSRSDPGFVCRALVTRAQVCRQETEALLDRDYGGSAIRLLDTLLHGRKLSQDEISRLRKLIEELP